MTDVPNTDPIDGLASDAHKIAEALSGQNRSRALGWALVLTGLLNAALLVAVIVIIQPILSTAATVQRVTGPDAQKAQAAATAAILEQFGKTVDCSQRANLSEAAALRGGILLPLKPGCPPYGFASPTPTTTSSPPAP